MTKNPVHRSQANTTRGRPAGGVGWWDKMSGVSLSAEERQKLEKNMKRAEEFERKEDLDLMRQPLEGQLMKFTNAFQGWQPRWFVLDPHPGELRYYLKEEHKQAQRQRGSLLLAGAVVSPSDEDSLAFSISPTAGEGFKLKAADTRQRSEWINRLRTAAEDQREKRLRKAIMSHVRTPEMVETVRRGTARETAVFHQIHRILSAAGDQQQAICRAADTLSMDEAQATDVLLLKATSQALLSNLEQCQSILIQFSRKGAEGRKDSDVSVRKASVRSRRTSSSRSGRTGSVEEVGQDVLLPASIDPVRDEDEVGDKDDYKDPELGSVDDHKSLILTSLSRMKLGTDLTKICFPVFCCQSRSFLETCSNFFANAELFVGVPDQENPEKRMLQLLKWYLSSFYSGCNNGSVKKPLNPVLGEIFRCMWIVPASKENIPEGGDPVDFPATKVKFLAEQVSHHPPVTAFYAHCPEKNMYLSGSVYSRPRFMGMSFSCALVGDVRLVVGARPGRRAECYTLAVPNVHARSILSTPWLELGGKVNIVCLNSGVTAGVTFHTKPFYGGKLHRITSEIKNCNGQFLCRVQGEWNRSLEFTFPDGRIQQLTVGNWKSRRKIRPLSKQHPRESRRVWDEVCKSMRNRDLESAAAQKKELEENQRVQMERLTETGKGYTSEDFQQIQGGGWIWKEFPGIFDE